MDEDTIDGFTELEGHEICFDLSFHVCIYIYFFYQKNKCFHFFAGNLNNVNISFQRESNSDGGNYSRNPFTTKADSFWLYILLYDTIFYNQTILKANQTFFSKDGCYG